MKIKTRFSPSPTGVLHMGSIRTALYSWLFARKLGGSFILRIEDTDFRRLKKNTIKDIIDTLSLLGLNWDEKPYYQSKRLLIYQKIISSMLLKGTAYKCYCSNQRLKMLRKKQILNKEKPRYDKKCRNLPSFFKESNISYVVRFKNPEIGKVEFTDLVRGKIIFLNSELDDLIIQRSNGMPTYNFCVVVDDYCMDITHVIRGDDHINNTPRQINLFKALKKNIPEYAHIPMILDENGNKLSKRNNVSSIIDYINKGYVPEALLNYIVRLGWSYKDKELFTLDEMKNLFNLPAVNKSPSRININKLLWFNRYYLRKLSVQEIKNYIISYFKNKNISIFLNLDFDGIINNFIHRHNTLQEFVEKYSYFYQDFDILEIIDIEKYSNIENIKILNMIYQEILNTCHWDIQNLSNIIKNVSLNLNINYKNVAMLLRISITGTQYTPGIALVTFYIGKKRVLLRLYKMLKYFNKSIIHNN